MKVLRPRAKLCAPVKRVKARLRAHAVFIYKFRRENNSTETRLKNGPKNINRHMMGRVGLEAARLSTFNRRCVITQREILEALAKLKPRRNAIPTDGA